MNDVTTNWVALVGVIILALVATCADAALRYTTDIEVVDGDARKRQVEIITLDGERARIEYFSGEQASDKPIVIMLTVDGGKTWVLSEGPNTECGEWDLEAFYRNAGSLVVKAEGWVNAKVTEAQVETLGRDAGPDILGYPTTRMRLLTTLHAKAKLLFLKYEYRVEITDEIWFSPDVELHPIEKRLLDAMAHTGYEQLDRMTQSSIDEIGGTILKQKTVARVRNVRKNTEESKVQNFVVTSIEKLKASELPQGLFEMPKCDPVDKETMDDKAKKVFKGLGFAY